MIRTLMSLANNKIQANTLADNKLKTLRLCDLGEEE